MKKTIVVRAKHTDRPCPKEGRQRVRLYEHSSGEMRDRFCIYHDEPLEVPSTRYYRRRIVAGDLELVKAPAKADAAPKPFTPEKTTKTTRAAKPKPKAKG